jgi:hypothetical protein
LSVVLPALRKKKKSKTRYIDDAAEESDGEGGTRADDDDDEDDEDDEELSCAPSPSFRDVRYAERFRCAARLCRAEGDRGGKTRDPVHAHRGKKKGKRFIVDDDEDEGEGAAKEKVVITKEERRFAQDRPSLASLLRFCCSA